MSDNEHSQFILITILYYFKSNIKILTPFAAGLYTNKYKN